MEIVKEIIQENEMKRYMRTKEYKLEKKMVEYQEKKEFNYTMKNYYRRYDNLKKVFGLKGTPNKYGIIVYVIFLIIEQKNKEK